MISVTVTHNSLPALLAALPAALLEAQTLSAHELLDTAKALAPVDTGELRDSGEVAPGDEAGSLVVRFTSDHAYWVHFGTAKMAPRPFLQWAVDQTQGRYLNRMRTLIADVARAAGAR